MESHPLKLKQTFAQLLYIWKRLQRFNELDSGSSGHMTSTRTKWQKAHLKF